MNSVFSDVPDFIDLSKINYSVTSIFDAFSIRLFSKDPSMKIKCSICSTYEIEQNVNCTENYTVQENIAIQKDNKFMSIKLNISCSTKDSRNNHYIEKLTLKPQYKKIVSSWKSDFKNIHFYLIYFMGNAGKFVKKLKINVNSFTMIKLKEKSWYQICIATIDDKWRTGIFTCNKTLTDFSVTGPVTNITASVNSEKMYLSWSKPKYEHDNPQGYIVRLNGDDIKLCRTIIISMTNIAIKSTNDLCRLQQHKLWTKLQQLEINDLPPYSNFNIDIIPVNGNKSFAKHEPLSTRTKEGESEAVQDLKMSLSTDGRIWIKFKAPLQTNGIIIKYIIKLILKKINICTNTNVIVYETDLKGKIKDWIEMKNVWKICGLYLIEVSPVNGWHQNDGVGKSVSTQTFRYSFETKSQISVLTTSISQNSFVVHLNNLRNNNNNNQCDTMGYIIKIYNENNQSNCVVRIFSVKKCNELNDQIAQKTNCIKREHLLFDTQALNIDSLFSGIFQYPMKYRYTVFRISDKIDEISSGIIDNSKRKDCFTDCYNKQINYSGIRSADKYGNICKQWKDSFYHYYEGTKSNICSSIASSYPWCPIENTFGRCDIPDCSTVKIATTCVRIQKNENFNESTKLMWSPPYYKGKIIGYITLLHNADHNCEQCHIQLCDNCESENQLGDKVKNIYLSCKSRHVDHSIKYESHFKDLHQNQEYIVYIMPIVNLFMIGEVKNMTIRTKLAGPAAPQNIHAKSRSLNGIELSWDKQNNFKKHGQPKYYILFFEEILLKVDNEKIHVPNLKFCTRYCFKLMSINDAGQSEMTNEKCYHTFAPKPSNIDIGGVESGYFTSQTLTWKYLGKDDCTRIYRLEYQVKYTNEITNKTTNESVIKLTNLKRNVNYTVKIRAEGQLETINNENIGKYSQIKEFYTGLVHLNVSYHNQNMDLTNKVLNISWGIIEEMQGSLFEFIIILKNSLKMCFYSIHFQCQNCQSPMNINNLVDNKQEARNNLLKCNQLLNKTYDADDVSFSYVINSEIKLTNFSVEIYGVNLLGVHQLNRKSTVVKLHERKGNIVTIIIISILVILILICLVIIILKRSHEPSFLQNILSKRKIPKNSNSIPFTQTSKSDKKSPETPNKPKLQAKKVNTAVNITSFCELYERLNQNGSAEIIKEYKKLGIEAKAVEASLKLTVDAGKDSNNSKKNRFVNILPFDQNRVKIGDKGYPRDYINASYIPFINNERKIEYIASQGPINGSLSDFWQMIWEQNIECIIMLTQTTEGDKFKCLQYWPDGVGENMSYGDKDQFNVKLIDEVDKEGHLERTFSVENTDTNEERNIMQLHMHTWFDHSAPNLDYFDKLLFRFQEIVSNNVNYPYLVHCSAGVGRTGTLICIDRIIKELAGGCQEINIYETVLKLRHYRNFLVQRQAQYIFIHDYLNHFISKYMKIEGNEEILYFNEDQETKSVEGF